MPMPPRPMLAIRSRRPVPRAAGRLLECRRGRPDRPGLRFEKSFRASCARRSAAASRASISSPPVCRRNHVVPGLGGLIERAVEERLQAFPLLRRHGSPSTASSAAHVDRAFQPRARHRPLPLDGGGRDSHGFRGLLDGQPAEVPELDDARLLGVERGEARQCFVEREHVDVSGASPTDEATASSSVTRCGAPPRLAAFRARARWTRICRIDSAAMARKCVRLANGGPLGGQADERFVDERSGLQRLARALAPDVACGDATQLVVDERHEQKRGRRSFSEDTPAARGRSPITLSVILITH